ANNVGQISASSTQSSGISVNLTDAAANLNINSFSGGMALTATNTGTIATNADNSTALGAVSLTSSDSTNHGANTITIGNALNASSISVSAASGNISATGVITTPSLSAALNDAVGASATFSNVANSVGQISGSSTRSSGESVNLTDSVANLNIN